MTRSEEIKQSMLSTPSITNMHEYMYVSGAEWADKNISKENIIKVLKALHACPYLTDEQIDHLPHGPMLDNVANYIKANI